ncbi:MAG: tRNA (adenosine(37)-N6)-threonylcarbamoyltransferase complex transferase subunit TsaD [Maricaulaceae bacterium]|jgi:N6-L-threonylcarbamoyladenine synthase
MMQAGHSASPAETDRRAAAPLTAPVTVLGLESSCDETAASVVRLAPGGTVNVLSDAVASQHAEHAPYGGVVPEIAARAHVHAIDGVIRQAMDEAGLGFADLNAIAATAGPGLVGGVMVALMTGKAIALAHDLPIIPVNHLEGHALSPRLSEPVAFPYLLLLVSGGHTQLLVVEDVGRYRRLGTTIDDAAGEAFDKLAKVMGLGHPGGPAIEKLAAEGDASRFDLPRPFVGTEHADFSFAGLKTAARRVWDGFDSPSDADSADLAASFQAAVAETLADRTRSALTRAGSIEALVVAGGVAANQAIRSALSKAAADAGVPLVAPPLKWCTDNAAMIALAGAERLARMNDEERDQARIEGLGATARPRWPLDEAAASRAPKVGSGRKGPKA